MGFRVWLVLVALLPLIDAEGYGEEETCKLVTPGVCVPRAEWGTPGLPPCVNFEGLLPEVGRFANTLAPAMAEIDISQILTHLGELQDAGNIEFRGPNAIPSGGVAAPHWTRPGPLTLLIYTVIVDGAERLFAFPSSQFDNLAPSDTLEGPIQSLQAGIQAFPTNYPNTVAVAMPSLVDDFDALLASFNTGGDNEGVTFGTDGVVQLGGPWSIVERPAIVYNPAGTVVVYILRYCGFRVVLRC